MRLAIIFSVLLLLLGQKVCAENKIQIHALNVGYADSYLIKLPDSQAILIDAADKENGLNVVNYLHKKDIKQIHTAIITHPHRNHFGGYSELLKHFPIGRLIHNLDPNFEEGYSDLLANFSRYNIPIQSIQAKEFINDLPFNLKIEVLSSPKLDASANANSLVLLLEYKNFEMLFSADIELRQQDELIAQQRLKSVDCLTVPHHGKGVSAGFLEFFKDKTFILSTSEKPWGPPDQAFNDFHGKLYRTDLGGNITIETDGREYGVTTNAQTD